MAEHTVKAFDEDITRIRGLIAEMGGLAEVAVQEAMDALINSDETLADAVVARDKKIDALEVEVDKLAVRIIALRAPMADDLREVVAALKISGVVERIGDYAKNIAKRTSVLVQMYPLEGAPSDLRRMAQAVEMMLKDALDSYIRRDLALAHDVRMRDMDVDQMYNALFRTFLTYMMEDPRNITGCMHMHFIAKNIERMGDHVTSIADQVIFLVTGEMPTEVRPKSDKTPFMTDPKDE